jgi:hypothetical protein
MPYVRLDNFGRAGGNYDTFETGLSASEWSFVTNVDLHVGDIVSAGADLPRGDPCPITPNYIYLYQVGNQSYDVISNGQEIYVAVNGEGWEQIGTGLGGGLVNYDVFKGCLIINSTTGGPYYWCPLGGAVALSWSNWHVGTWSDLPFTSWNTIDSSSDTGIRRLPGWPENAVASQVVAYKDQLVALAVSSPDIDDASPEYLIRWSSLAPAGSLPASWTPAVGNFAGFAYVQDTPGPLAAAKLLRNDLILYKIDSIWRLTATGDPGLPMVLERVLTCRGVETPSAVAACGEVHFMATDRGFGIFDGNQFQHLDFLRTQDAITRSIAQNAFEFVQCAYYGGRQEVWIGYRLPNDDSGVAAILKYNVQHDAFCLHYYIPPSAPEKVLSFAPGRNVVGSAQTSTWTTWGDGYTWETLPYNSWVDTLPVDTAEVMVLGFSNQLASYTHDVDPKYLDGSAKEAVLERHGIRFSGERTATLKALYPESAYEPIGVEVGTSWSPAQEIQGTTQWQPKRTFTPGVDRVLPQRVIGDTFALRVTSENQFRLHAIGLEYRDEAKR